MGCVFAKIQIDIHDQDISLPLENWFESMRDSIGRCGGFCIVFDTLGDNGKPTITIESMDTDTPDGCGLGGKSMDDGGFGFRVDRNELINIRDAIDYVLKVCYPSKESRD